MSALACPLDRLVLERAVSSWRCPSGHSYDVSKDGYVNLLPPGKPSRAKSGDDLDSIHARRRFLADGYYAPLADLVAAMSAALAPATTVDIGCGEGYYTAGLAGDELIGLDLSRAGIRLAARRYKNATFAVANAMALPVANASVDLAVSVFAPVIPASIVASSCAGVRAQAHGAGREARSFRIPEF